MSDKPIRIQRKRRKGWRMPANTVYVGRPSKFGNPYHLGHCTYAGFEILSNAEAVREFEADIRGNPQLIIAVQEELRGKNLACWCKVGEPCHADVLLAIANEEAS